MCKNVGLDECDCGFNDEAAAPVAAAESSCRLVRRQYMVQPAIGRAVQPIVQAVSPPNIEGAQTETQIRTPIEPQTQAPADCMGYPSIHSPSCCLAPPTPSLTLSHPERLAWSFSPSLRCRITGTLTGFGVAAYLAYERTQVPLTSPGHRLLLATLSATMLGVGIFRAIY